MFLGDLGDPKADESMSTTGHFRKSMLTPGQNWHIGLKICINYGIFGLGYANFRPIMQIFVAVHVKPTTLGSENTYE